MSDVPPSHPRYVSLRCRDVIVAGVDKGITSPHGLIAHGRGEALDYLIGERTRPFARQAARAAAALLLLAERPVISVNGNVAALVAVEMVELGRILGAPLEINIFHASKTRERKMKKHLLENGATQILMPSTKAELPFIDSQRRFVHPEGIFKADVVFVPLEDGDRCEALRKMGKKVVVVDLNPLSRTARKANMALVDNVVRAVPVLIEEIGKAKKKSTKVLKRVVATYDHRQILDAAEQCLRRGGRA